MIPISEKLSEMLQDQLAHELGNKYSYTNMASWAHVRGLKNIEKLFKSQADGEQGHSELIAGLLNDANIPVVVKTIAERQSTFNDCMAIAEEFERVEAQTTDRLDAIYQAAEGENAVGVSNFLQGMLQEQIEEMGLADRFKTMVEISAGSLFMLDLMLD